MQLKLDLTPGESPDAPGESLDAPAESPSDAPDRAPDPGAPPGPARPSGTAERTRVALALARSLMDAEGLEGWTVRINRRLSSRFGLCKFHRREIHLAAWLVEEAPWHETEDTVRHEVAHAVVGPGHGHDRVWKAAAARLGARPARCGSTRTWSDHAPAARRVARWVVVCTGCGARFLRHRRPRGRHVHGECGAPVKWLANPERG